MQTHMPPGMPPRPKGPLVFLDYDQQELDAAYDQAPWAPNQAELAKRVAPNGTVIVSGFTRAADVARAFADVGLRVHSRRTRDGWSCLQLLRSSRR